jgi:membrane protease YdiL (CAAX protease family)
MNKNSGGFKLYNEAPLYQIFVSILIILGVGGVMSIVLILAGGWISGAELSVFLNSATSPETNHIGFMRYLIIVQDISFLLIPSIIIIRMMKSESSARFPDFKLPQLKDIGLVVILTFCIFSITSFTGQLNSAMHLPGWLSGVELWMTEQEDKADKTIDLLIASKTSGSVILNLMNIALIPAFAEELFFRGVFQKIFKNLFKSGHIAIWVTAFIFSSIHLQFFGFIPRFILGLVFGYLFFWSGTLWLPIISHFVNNAVPVILTYVQGMDKLNAPNDLPLWHQAIYLPLPIAISLIILFYFRNENIPR